MIEMGQILTALVKRTEEGKLKWSRTVDGPRYITSVDAISVLINQEPFQPERYQLEILDEDGDTVESLTYFDTSEEQDKELARLFVLARRSAHNVDTTLNKLAKGLELT